MWPTGQTLGEKLYFFSIKYDESYKGKENINYAIWQEGKDGGREKKAERKNEGGTPQVLISPN